MLPLKVFIHFIFIMHPGFSVDKELQEGEYEHEGEGHQRHWTERRIRQAKDNKTMRASKVSTQIGLVLPVPPLAVVST